MKIVKQAEEFQPVKVTVTFESEEELLRLHSLYGMEIFDIDDSIDRDDAQFCIDIIHTLSDAAETTGRG